MKFNLIDLFWLILLAGLACLWCMFFVENWDFTEFLQGLTKWDADARGWRAFGNAVRALIAMVSAICLLVASGALIASWFNEPVIPEDDDEPESIELRIIEAKELTLGPDSWLVIEPAAGDYWDNDECARVFRGLASISDKIGGRVVMLPHGAVASTIKNIDSNPRQRKR